MKVLRDVSDWCGYVVMWLMQYGYERACRYENFSTNMVLGQAGNVFELSLAFRHNTNKIFLFPGTC